MKYNITYKSIKKFSKNFNKKSTNKVLKNINTKGNFKDLVIKADFVQTNHKKFSNTINVNTKITDQQKSGRCWLFAMLNVIRLDMIRKYNLENFEFSENYLFFYDRLEKANFFLNFIVNNYNRNIDNDIRLIHVLNTKTNDGNHWSMFKNLISKYGIIPKDAMSDHFHSKNSKQLNVFFNNFLSKTAESIINSLKHNSSNSNKKFLIEQALNKCYKILVIFLGEPPKKFDWHYFTVKDEKDEKDKKELLYSSNKRLVQKNDLTPLSFYKKFVKYNVDDKLYLINNPCKKYYNKYYVELSPDVIGGKQQEYINVPQNIILNGIKKSIDDEQAVWCGIDWQKFNTDKNSMLDQKAFNYHDIFGDDNMMDKCAGLRYKQSKPTHAVIIRGYNLDANNKIDRFLVENSHGDSGDFTGFYGMSIDWFNQYLYKAVIDKKYLTGKTLQVEKKTNNKLEFHSPFGGLL